MDGVLRKQGRERNGKITSKKNPLPKQRIIYGRGGETRTRDTRFWRPVLYQLSYAPKVFAIKPAGRAGLMS